MKKIKENTLLHYSIVLTIVATFCGFAIGLTNFITAPIIAERLETSELEAYESVMPSVQRIESLEEGAVFSVVKAFNDEQMIGYIYTVTETNQYGDFTIITGVDIDGTVLGATFLDYQQTPTLKQISEENLVLFVGLNILIQSPSASDVSSGATYSYDSIVRVFSSIVAFQTALIEGENNA